MNLRILTTVSFGAALLFCACEKEETEAESETSTENCEITTNVNRENEAIWKGDAIHLTNLFSINYSAVIQIFLVDVSSPARLTGKQGTTIQFYGNSFKDAAGYGNC